MLNVLFIHSAWENQFADLHKYFLKHKLANSYFLTTEACRSSSQFKKDFPDNVYSYTPDGDASGDYFFAHPATTIGRHGLRIFQAVQALTAEKKIDVIVAHSNLGTPQFLFDIIKIPVVTYMEFPSFQKHGIDPLYPAEDAQVLIDANMEALNFYAVHRSAGVIVPSLHAKNMLPKELHNKVHVQMEGFDPVKLSVNIPSQLPFTKEEGLIYIGFAARTLSSEKGFEQFVRVSKILSERNPNMRFVVIGEKKAGLSYGFENSFLDKKFGRNGTEIAKTFADYLFEEYEVDTEKYIMLPFMDLATFSTVVHHVDIFLCPIQFGSANWGVFELLMRGKIVIGSNRCFMPEIITNGENGFLLDYHDKHEWVELVEKISSNLGAYRHIGEAAQEAGKKFHVDKIATSYLKLLKKIIKNAA